MVIAARSTTSCRRRSLAALMLTLQHSEHGSFAPLMYAMTAMAGANLETCQHVFFPVYLYTSWPQIPATYNLYIYTHAYVLLHMPAYNSHKLHEMFISWHHDLKHLPGIREPPRVGPRDPTLYSDLPKAEVTGGNVSARRDRCSKFTGHPVVRMWKIQHDLKIKPRKRRFRT